MSIFQYDYTFRYLDLEKSRYGYVGTSYWKKAIVYTLGKNRASLKMSSTFHWPEEDMTQTIVPDNN